MSSTRQILAGLAFAGALALGACGGTVVFEEDGGAGANDGGGGHTTSGNAGSQTSSASTTSSAPGVTSGSAGGTSVSSQASAGGSPDTVAASASSGEPFCTSHEACGERQLCLFATGECAPACAPDSCDSCGEGRVCDSCASSSCPECPDCLAACVPTQPGRCDDDDGCPEGELCNYFGGFCEEACRPDGTCVTPGKFCDPCATSTCCSCDSCSGLCIFGDD